MKIRNPFPMRRSSAFLFVALLVLGGCNFEQVLDPGPGDTTGDIKDPPPIDNNNDTGGTPPDDNGGGTPPDDTGGGTPPDDNGGGTPPDDPPSGVGLLGNSMPADWRPFAPGSPWNTPIPANAAQRPGAATVLSYMASQADHIRFSRSYTIPVWIVNSDEMDPVIVRSDRIYDTWDRDNDGWSDVGVPLSRDMWGENTGDGHICVIDPYKQIAWEMSRFHWSSGSSPQCTTFNIWDLSGRGYADADAGGTWQTIGGRGSGFPLIAGLIRPEEVEAGEIHHALVFTFGSNRKADNGANLFISPPGARSDGKFTGDKYPIEGSLFQLDPSLTESDFDSWGLAPSARVVARALQRYGMYLCDNGGDWALQVQLLSSDSSTHVARWNERVPGFYNAVEDIPTDAFRLIDTGTVITK
jgi:hypothetical protein